MAAALSASSNTLRRAALFGEIAAFHHHQRIAGGIVEKRFEQFRKGVAGAAHPHHAPPAHHRDRGGLVGQPRGIVDKRGFVEIGDAERIGEIGHHRS